MFLIIVFTVGSFYYRRIYYQQREWENERKQLEKELLDFNQTLEKQVAQEVAKNMQNERMLIHQSRMAAMGEMVGNIAHQWRQPLNSLNVLLYSIKEAYQYNEMDESFYIHTPDTARPPCR